MDTISGFRCIRRSSQKRFHVQASAFPPPGGGRGPLSRLHRYYSDAKTSGHPSRRSFVFLRYGRYHGGAGVSLPRAGRRARAGPGCCLRRPPLRRRYSVEMAGAPKFPQNPCRHAQAPSTPEESGGTRLGAPSDAATVKGTTGASSRILSRLNRLARRLAVYASQGAVARAPRKTRLRLLAKLCRAGFTPAGFYTEVSVMFQLHITSSSRELCLAQSPVIRFQNNQLRLGGRGRLPARGSRSPVRACINAYGSSSHGLAVKR